MYFLEVNFMKNITIYSILLLVSNTILSGDYSITTPATFTKGEDQTNAQFARGLSKSQVVSLPNGELITVARANDPHDSESAKKRLQKKLAELREAKNKQ